MKTTSITTTWIRSITMSLVLIFSLAPWSSITAFAATPPQVQPNYGTITVDGNYSDWNLPVDFFAYMYNAGDQSKFPDPVAATYLRYDCASQIMYVLVLAVPPHVINTTDYLANDFVKINGGGAVPWLSFVWVNQNGTQAEGWEASFALSSGNSYQFKIHTLVDGGATASPTPATDTIPLDVFCHDKGDLPEGISGVPDYHMTLVYDSNGNFIPTGAFNNIGDLRLGTQIDGENNGQPDATATGDDISVRDDEDGVVPVANSSNSFWAHGQGEIDVTVNGGPGCLMGWMDFWDSNIGAPNLNITYGAVGDLGTDGDFNDSGTTGAGSNQDQPWSEVIVNNQYMTNGTTHISFLLPYGISNLPMYARFRIVPSEDGTTCNQTAVAPTGEAKDSSGNPTTGEVEDYRWGWKATAVTLNSFTAGSTSSTQSTAVWLVLPVLGAALATLIWKARRRFSS
jgi:hypothetical protein